ncbi:MAG: CoA pyrophosphatase [Sphingobacteriales bacterium]|nr:MAG: CoA pyrophosphatase [Sphingobacteriales bacterium]
MSETITRQNIIEWLKKRLQLPLPGNEGQERMAARVKPMPDKIPTNARPSAVLCVLYPVDDKLTLLLIKRTVDGRAHSGQVGFPGGKQEPSDADLKATALREAQEEVGILSADVDILGALTPLYIPVSNFQVYPFVAYAKERPIFNISESEVSNTIEVAVEDLLHEDNKTVVNVTSPIMPEILRSVRAYKLPGGGIIWGATAMIISELETVLEEYA